MTHDSFLDRYVFIREADPDHFPDVQLAPFENVRTATGLQFLLSVPVAIHLWRTMMMQILKAAGSISQMHLYCTAAGAGKVFSSKLLYRVMLLMGVLILIPGAEAQGAGRWNFNIGGGIGFPQGDLSNFINDGANFVVGGGYNVNKYLSTNGEFMWHDLPVNSATKQALQTPDASARQYAVTFDPMVHIPLGHHLGAYAIGGIGWYHRSGETTTPGLAVICDPYWSWWYGCTIGEVQVVTGSTSADSFGENIGGGLTYRLGDSGLKFYTEVRYHHADYHKVSTNLIPLTFGIRW